MGRRLGTIVAILLVLGLAILMNSQIKFMSSKITCDSINELLISPCSTDSRFFQFTNHPYNEYIVANRSGVCPQLIYAVILCESELDSHALSPVGAKGLMQLMPCIYEGKGDPYNPSSNIRMGSEFLKELLVRYHNDVWRAVAAYNCGPGNVDRVQGIPKIKETQKFVKAVKQKYEGTNAK